MDAAQSFNRAIAHINDDRVAQCRKDPTYQALLIELVGAGVLSEEQYCTIFNCPPPMYIPGKRNSHFRCADFTEAD